MNSFIYTLGHDCPHKLKLKRKDQVNEKVDSFEIGIQVELDDQMTVRLLPLELQGYPESYIPIPSQQLQHSSSSASLPRK